MFAAWPAPQEPLHEYLPLRCPADQRTGTPDQAQCHHPERRIARGRAHGGRPFGNRHSGHVVFPYSRHQPRAHRDPARDIYIQSKGHGVGGLYCCLAQAGYIPEAWLPEYQHFNSRLPGHPVRQKTPGIELNTGALGHGLPVAVGLALAA
ncbi:hypothetical protein F2S74_12390, partial [Pseudomonas syringae pv. actinidiae]|nr:hypothetical protein [Pseudomonas syringae pv. actinidiae]